VLVTVNVDVLDWSREGEGGRGSTASRSSFAMSLLMPAPLPDPGLVVRVRKVLLVGRDMFLRELGGSVVAIVALRSGVALIAHGACR
jgi:hypothetical protein